MIDQRTDSANHPAVRDRLERPLRSLRLSVTDRCNLRCSYCMPEEEYTWLERDRLLTFEEMSTVADAFAALGVRRVRLTGGEPLLRRDLPVLVEMLARKTTIDEVAMTTNGLKLAEYARELRAAGLDRVTVSLDTLRAQRFIVLTKRDELDHTIAGIRAARAAGFERIKLDSVILRGFNDDELVDLIEFGRAENLEVRFIEYMDVGGATQWSLAQVLSRAVMLERLAAHYGAIEEIEEESSAPADRFRLPDGTVFGIISSTTQPFCASCDRSRVTADGMWFTCLYARDGINLRDVLRDGAGVSGLRDTIAGTWSARRDRGAEERHELVFRKPLADSGELRSNPHLEMHTRGG